MRPTQFSADTVVALLRKQTVASLTDVMAAFGPRVSRRTAFRKLKDLHARTSYSHRGGYYTLDELADFDEHGLWTFAGVRFSRAGTLVATAEAFVNHAEAGHFVDELDNLLGVGTQDALRKLVGDGRLTRHKLAGHFLYCATDHAHQTHQLRARRLLMATPGLGRPLPDADLMPEELRAAIVLFASLLDEHAHVSRSLLQEQETKATSSSATAAAIRSISCRCRPCAPASTGALLFGQDFGSA